MKLAEENVVFFFFFMTNPRLKAVYKTGTGTMYRLKITIRHSFPDCIHCYV